MQRVALTFFIAFELCYYLLIAQTGIVEYFSSNITLIAPLPIGGVIGSLLSFYIKTSNHHKIKLFLSLQLLMTLFYPNLSVLFLFLLGISVGALAPLLINELKRANVFVLGMALAISYTAGTFLFTYPVEQRGNIAIALTLITLLCSLFLPDKKVVQLKSEPFSLFAMVLWIFLDSTLFETLSRDLSVSIWRDGYSVEIALFHILGVVAALTLTFHKNQKELIIISLFALSYLLYFMQEPLLLSFVYPFVISYYNVVILQSLIQKELKTLAVYMVFIGWFASGAGLFVALENLTIFVPFLFFLASIKLISTHFIHTKETPCIN